MVRLTFTIVILLLWCAETSAQRRLVVVDVETGVPVVDANVTTEKGAGRTDSLGYICVNDSSKTLVLTHVNYESRMVKLENLRDTVFLISKLLNLKEVIVFGKDRQEKDYRELKKKMTPNVKDMQLAAAGANMNGGLNLMGLIGYLIPDKKKLSKKERKKRKLKEILDNY